MNNTPKRKKEAPEETPILGFFHVACMGSHWQSVVNELVEGLEAGDLLANTSRLHVTVVNADGACREWIVARFGAHPNVDIDFTDDGLHEYEFPSIRKIQSCCRKPDGRNFHIYYFHTKGVSSDEKFYSPYWKYWRRWMRDSVLVGWRRHRSALIRGNHLSGDYWGRPGHFSGNFWWARSEYLATLPDIDSLYDRPVVIWDGHPTEENRRIMPEFWLGMCDAGFDLYVNATIDGTAPGMIHNFGTRIFQDVDDSKTECVLNSAGFDAIYVISLERRPDRRASAMAEFQRIGLRNVQIFNALDSRRLNVRWGGETHMAEGAVGCFLSHYLLVSDAVRRGFNQILVFEDDLRFVNGFNEIMEFVWPQVPEDWEFLWLGWTERGGPWDVGERISPNIVRPKSPHGTQAYALRGEGLKIANHYLGGGMVDHVDIMYDRLVNPQTRSYMVYPSLVEQNSSLSSDIAHESH